MAVSEASPLRYQDVLRTCSSDGIANVPLSSGTAQAIAIPAGARAANFAFNVDIWVAFGTTQAAASPSSYSSAGSSAACVFNPTLRYFASTNGTTALSLYSDYTGKGSIEFYR